MKSIKRALAAHVLPHPTGPMHTNGPGEGPAGVAPEKAYRASWKLRAIRATRGNQSKLGAILIAVLGRIPGHPPRFGLSAIITSDGFVLSDFEAKNGVAHSGAFVCGIDELVRNFRGLADHIKATDVERIEMFRELSRWITRDYRAKSTLD